MTETGSDRGSGSGSQATGQQAQQAADPFASYRPGMASQYNDAMKSGGTTDPTQMPGYSQWMSGVLQPALTSVQAQDTATGRAHSGQEQQDLLGVAQKGYYGFMTDYMNRLAQGSGATNNPAPAAGMGLQQQQQNQQGFMQGVGGILQGVQGIQNNQQTQPGTTVPPGAGTDYGPTPSMQGGNVSPDVMQLGGY